MRRLRLGRYASTWLAFVALVWAAVASTGHAELASRSEEKRVSRIAVLGDSLAEGLWGGLYRRYWRDRSVRIINLSRASTGFNVDSYVETLTKALARHPIDLLIVQAGANDRQRVVGIENREVAAFGTARWHDLYAQRVILFLATAQRHEVPVLWVGLPAMRDPRFDGGMRLISRVHQTLAERHGAYFLDIVALTTDDEGAYLEFLTQPAGRTRRLRHVDGVHSWELGYERLAVHVEAAIRARFPGLLPDR